MWAWPSRVEYYIIARAFPARPAPLKKIEQHMRTHTLLAGKDLLHACTEFNIFFIATLEELKRQSEYKRKDTFNMKSTRETG